jgi:phosphate-induced protein 1
MSMAFALSCGLVAAVAGAQAVNGNDDELVPTGKGWGEHHAQGQANPNGNAKPVHGNGISYHGGPVMLGTTNAYYIWYGNWSGNSATTILTDLARSIGGSPYFNINTTYYNGSNVHVSNSVSYSGSTTDNYSRGTSLSDSGVLGVVSDAITSGRLPKDTSGVYFVLTSQDVNESSGFCTQYCGWHTHGTIGGSDIKYAFIGNAARCLSACAAQSTGPNGNAGADGMASIISHELEEAVTDPDLNAWYDTRGAENADKCAWTFGTTYSSGGALANMRLGSRDYLIQRNWVNANGGLCALSYP